MLKVYGVKVNEIEEEILAKYWELLPASQKKRIEKYKREKPKKLSLCGAALLKYALTKEGIREYDILYTEYGKPVLIDNPIQFNFSHSSNRVICAVSNKAVGCDVQKVKEISNGIPSRFFTSSECEIIKNSQNKTDMFFRLWAIRESFIKATGLGMAYCQGKFQAVFKNGVPYVEQSIDDSSYFIRELFLDKDYKYAVCSLTDDEPDFSWIDLNAAI